MLYGIAFTQYVDNNLIGVLIFKTKARALLTQRILVGNDGELESLDENLNAVLKSDEFKDIPEFDESDVQERMIINNKLVEIINIDYILNIE